MKRTVLLGLLAAIVSLAAIADHVVILHTNDTHSQIDPLADGTGGVLRRKALIDSVRAVRDNVILVDAGDAVQGSVFFTLFKGEVEQKLLNALGYDIQILGNHEFDNGMAQLRHQLEQATPRLLATNYDLSATSLDALFHPYRIMNVGDKRIGFFAVNIDPEGLIDADTCEGVRYLDASATANAMASYLRNVENADVVIAVTHIGYETNGPIDDVRLAHNSKDIDIIIGGHSHTLIDPSSSAAHISNAEGRDVLVLQTRNKGSYLGEIDIDLATGERRAMLHRVDARLDNRLDPTIKAIIEPYRQKVDSISAIVVASAPKELEQTSPELLNWLTDYVMDKGAELAGRPVDIAIMNKGGIRNAIPRGAVTKGDVMNMLPFHNNIVVMELSGADLLENLKVMAGQDGNGLSRGMEVVYDPTTDAIIKATLNGKDIDPRRTYCVATISYLAKGGDYMTPLTRGKIISRSKDVIFEDILESMDAGLLKGKPVAGSAEPRMKPRK